MMEVPQSPTSPGSTTTTFTTHPSDHDVPESSSNQYVDSSSNDLNIWSGATLIAADIMGTGILALPNAMKVLGPFGYFFLLLNLPINYYAGDILHQTALYVENRIGDCDNNGNHGHGHDNGDGVSRGRSRIRSTAEEEQRINRGNEWNYDEQAQEDSVEMTQIRKDYSGTGHHDAGQHNGIESPHTFDFIGISYAIFDHFQHVHIMGSETLVSGTSTSITTVSSKASSATIFIAAMYYINIFLVLGSYILVMSHAVAAVVGEENICLPHAGIIASTLMFAMSQLRTMAMLGKLASFISLLSLAIVIGICLMALQSQNQNFRDNNQDDRNENDNIDDRDGSFLASLVSQLAALASIGFAVASQKLLLNIRHEFQDRTMAPKSLGISQVAFGSVYVLVCLFAGPNPPSFLFQAIPSGLHRQIGGFFLWVHVAVSYAINSQALCSSFDRLKCHGITMFGLNEKHKTRWAMMTLTVALSSYFIANAVPFFKDLVALIGALTSVPLALLLPALYHRKILGVPLFWIDSSLSQSDLPSFSLVAFSLFFLLCGTAGSLWSIYLDWEGHGRPFACN